MSNVLIYLLYTSKIPSYDSFIKVENMGSTENFVQEHFFFHFNTSTVSLLCDKPFVLSWRLQTAKCLEELPATYSIGRCKGMLTWDAPRSWKAVENAKGDKVEAGK